jgi:hypothetical protein
MSTNANDDLALTISVERCKDTRELQVNILNSAGNKVNIAGKKSVISTTVIYREKLPTTVLSFLHGCMSMILNYGPKSLVAGRSRRGIPTNELLYEIKMRNGPDYKCYCGCYTTGSVNYSCHNCGKYNYWRGSFKWDEDVLSNDPFAKKWQGYMARIFKVDKDTGVSICS